MKRLHKKIGVGVLVAGLLIGGVGGLGGSVVHADEKSDKEAEEILRKAIESRLNEKQKSAVKIMYELLESSYISRKGRKASLLDAIDISDGKSGVKLHEGLIKYNYCFDKLKMALEDLPYIIVSEVPRNSFIRVKINELDLEVLFIVL